MPSPRGPCPCPSCKGAIKSAATVKKHVAEQAQIAAEKAKWQHQYENAATQANEDHGSDPELSEDDQDIVQVESRPSKRARVNDERNDMVSILRRLYLYVHLYST